MKAASTDDCRKYAASIVSEMINSLESVNNLVYLLNLFAHDPNQSGRLVEMIQSQLPLLNQIVKSTLDNVIVEAGAESESPRHA
jgi:hypothetical protein